MKERVDSWWGWIVVLASAFNRIIIYGVSYTAGIVYVIILEVFDEGSGITSWISSLITAVVFFTCPLSGYLIGRFGERKVAVAGALIAAIGMTSSAFVNSVPALMVTYGIVAGFGCGLAFMPGSVAVAKYFKNHRTLALSIASAGGGIGGFAFPPILELLNETYNWRGMFLILGGVTLNGIVFGLLFRPIQKDTECDKHSSESGYSSDKAVNNEEHNSQLDLEISPLNEDTESEDSVKADFCSRHFYFKIPVFYILLINNFMYQFGTSIIYGHLKAYAVYELKFTPASATILYTIIGVMVLIFKLLHGALANIQSVKIFRPIYQYIFFYLIGGIATLCLLIKSVNGIYFYSVVFGMSYAANGGSLLPSILIDIAGVETLGMTYGIVLMCLSLGQLTGAPIAGIMYEHLQSYDAAFILAGSLMVGSALIMVYPCRNALNPDMSLKQSQHILQENAEQIILVEENPPLVLDPVSASMVRGSIVSLHHISRQNSHSLSLHHISRQNSHNLSKNSINNINNLSKNSINNIHNHENYAQSSQVLHHIEGHSDSLESLEVGPRSSSFSGNTKGRPRAASADNSQNISTSPLSKSFHPTTSPLALDT